MMTGHVDKTDDSAVTEKVGVSQINGESALFFSERVSIDTGEGLDQRRLP